MSAVAIGALLLPTAPPRVWTVLAVGAALPDLDAIGRPFGHGDLALLGGHRALTHSLVAAATLGLLATTFLVRRAPESVSSGRMLVALSLAFASHGLLDALTRYGQGVAFFAPWTWQRFRAPWTPLAGFATDTVLFSCAFLLARTVIQRRGWRLPRWLAPTSRAPVA